MEIIYAQNHIYGNYNIYGNNSVSAGSTGFHGYSTEVSGTGRSAGFLPALMTYDNDLPPLQDGHSFIGGVWFRLPATGPINSNHDILNMKFLLEEDIGTSNNVVIKLKMLGGELRLTFDWYIGLTKQTHTSNPYTLPTDTEWHQISLTIENLQGINDTTGEPNSAVRVYVDGILEMKEYPLSLAELTPFKLDPESNQYQNYIAFEIPHYDTTSVSGWAEITNPVIAFDDSLSMASDGILPNFLWNSGSFRDLTEIATYEVQAITVYSLSELEGEAIEHDGTSSTPILLPGSNNLSGNKFTPHGYDGNTPPWNFQLFAYSGNSPSSLSGNRLLQID